MAAVINLVRCDPPDRRRGCLPSPPPVLMEPVILDWSLPNFLSLYQSSWTVNAEGIPSTRRSLLEPYPSSPVYSIDFGNMTAKWSIKLRPYLPPPPPPAAGPDGNNDNSTAKEFWNFHLDLISAEINPGSNEPPVRRRRIDGGGPAGIGNGSLVELKVKCQLFFLRNPRNERWQSSGEGDSTPAQEVTFGPNCGSVELGWPTYSGHDRREAHNEAHQIQRYLWKWLSPPAARPAPASVARRQELRASFRENLPDRRMLCVRVRLTEIEFRNVAASQGQAFGGLTANLLTDLGHMLDSGEDSDVVIKCGPAAVSFPVHKFILSLRSPVFKAMLQSGMAEAISGVINIPDTEPAVMRQFLEFLYTANIKVSNSSSDMDQVIALIAVADKYEVTDLKHVCFQRLFANLNEETCGRLAVAAYLHNADVQQKNLIYEYNAEHWRELGSKAEFQALVEACPAAFLRR